MARKLQNHKTSGLFSSLLKKKLKDNQTDYFYLKKKKKFLAKNLFAKFQSKIIFYS